MLKQLMVLSMLALAGAAQADDKQTAHSLLSGNGGGWSHGGFSERSLYVYNTNNIQSWDSYDDSNNVTDSIFLGANAHITGIGWDVELMTLRSPSWLSEIAVGFESSAGLQLTLAPGAGDDFGGSDTYSSGGVVDLIGLGLDFNLGADGILGLDFFENFDDFSDTAEGLWKQGALTIQYEVIPAPSALALMGLGGLVATRRRR
jgi:hypothetical protein